MNTQFNRDQEEIERFSAQADQWWDEDGAFALLHQLNPLRLRYILDQLGQVGGRDILDVGCGGGLLCEPLARQGAHVIGLDASSDAILVAKQHAGELPIDYRCGTIETVSENNFDAILAMEIVEHLDNVPIFIQSCAKRLNPGGKLILSTINRTPEAFALAIVAAEYILRWLPAGTHHYDKLVKPDEIKTAMRAANMDCDHQIGVIYDPIGQSFHLSSMMRVNYMIVGVKRSSPPHG